MKMYQLVALAEGEKLPAAVPEYNHAEARLLECFRAMPEEERKLFQAMGESLSKYSPRT
jgi:hypothetical protein